MPYKFSPGHCSEDCGCGGAPPCTPGGSSILMPCLPCDITCNLGMLLAWTNLLTGSGSIQMILSGPGEWTTPCSGGIIYKFGCVDGQITLTATAYTDGTCPTGSTVVCSSADGGMTLLPTSVCSPFTLRFGVNNTTTGCNYLRTRGFTQFGVAQ